MSPRNPLLLVVLAAPLALVLSGCTYDYLQHSDRVAYKAGDAVAANLESETIDPSKRSMYLTSGLGKNGSVQPLASNTSSSSSGTTPAPGTPAPAPAAQ